MVPEAVLQALREAQRILCIAHVDPDGDAYGSILALKWMLEGAGKQVGVGIDSPPDDTYAFLPGFEEVTPARGLQGEFDLIVIADSSSLDRMGDFAQLACVKRAPWLMIDHHPTNTRFGTPELHWVEPSHLSTCNMVVHLASQLGYELGVNGRNCAMTGMITDSLCFRVPGTDEAFIRDVLAVMGSDAFSPYEVISHTGALSFEEFRLWAEVLPSMRLESGILWLQVRERQLAKTGDGGRARISGLIQKMLEVREARVAVIFTEKTKNGCRGVNCSLRCRPELDVSGLALSYAGGGHRTAAGCFIEAPLEKVIPDVLHQIKGSVLGL